MEGDHDNEQKASGRDLVAMEGGPREGGLLKRREVAQVLGISESSVRRMEGTQLMPMIGPDGVRQFRVEDVRELTVRKVKFGPRDPAEYDGRLAAQVFRLLDEGLHPIAIVERLEQDPRMIAALHRQYVVMRGGFVLSAADVNAIEELAWLEGTFPTESAAQLISNLRKSSPRGCQRCTRGEAEVCVRCARALTAREATGYERETNRRKTVAGASKRTARAGRDELHGVNPRAPRRSAHASVARAEVTKSVLSRSETDDEVVDPMTPATSDHASRDAGRASVAPLSTSEFER